MNNAFTEDHDEELAVRQSHSWDEETETCRKCGATMTDDNEVELCPRGVQ